MCASESFPKTIDRSLMRPQSTARHLYIALLPLALAACAAQRGIELPPLPDWDTRTRVLGGINDWEFKGRIGISSGNEGFDANFRYAQERDDFIATVSGPLGIGTILIEGNGHNITVTDKDGEEWLLTDPEADLHVMYGWTIPVRSLRYWALGIPDPAGFATTDFNEQGQLASLEQDGWLVRITRYREGGGQPMPRALKAVSGENTVRLAIHNWTFR